MKGNGGKPDLHTRKVRFLRNYVYLCIVLQKGADYIAIRC